MLDLVIFDCDGVLVDSEPVTCAVMAEVLSEIGLAKTTEQCLSEYVGMWWPDVVGAVEAELGRALPRGFTQQYRRRQNEALSRGVEPVEGVVEALELIEARICVASNGPPEKMRITLGGAGLLERFEGAIFSAGQVSKGKPAPDLFLHAASKMNADPFSCVVVEDSPLGVEAAGAAGMQALGFSAHSQADALALEAAGAVVFDSMRRLPELLEASAAGH